MSTADYYNLLGVSPTATPEEIRRAYRQLARRTHPDANPSDSHGDDANRRMAQLNEAYGVLSDAAQRTEYDSQRRYVLESQAWWAGPKQTVWATRAGAQESRSQIAFVATARSSVVIGLIAIVTTLAGFSLMFGSSIPLGLGLVLAGMLGGTVSVMAVLPTFRGYVVLAPDRLIEYPAFGLAAKREYPYAQICDVYTQVYRIPLFSAWSSNKRYHVVIDYFARDPLGRLETRWFHSKRMMAVQNHHHFVRLLRKRASAYKHRLARPTWSASLVSAWEWLYSALWGTGMALVFIGCWGVLLWLGQVLIRGR